MTTQFKKEYDYKNYMMSTITGIYGQVSTINPIENDKEINSTKIPKVQKCKYDFEVKNESSGKEVDGGYRIPGLPEGMTQDEYFKMALIKSIESNTSALNKINRTLNSISSVLTDEQLKKINEELKEQGRKLNEEETKNK